MYRFKNIDDYTPGYFERIGTLRGKRWYSKNDRNGLFKPRRFEFGDRKVFAANHYGEFMGYLLAQAIDVDACEVELVHLSKFYENYFKFKNNGTPIPRDGAISYKEGPRDETIIPGNVLISKYNKVNEMELLHNNRNIDSLNDEIPTIMHTVKAATIDFYTKRGCSPEVIKEKVDRNIADIVRMICYDCSFGNNDRHDENWSMVVSGEEMKIYPLYDNERVLGLCENINIVRYILSNPSVLEAYNMYGLHSRMSLPGGKRATYQEVLVYMLENYPEVTKKTLDKVTTRVKPSIVKNKLQQLEGLPEEYIELSSRIYDQRYSFIEKALSRSKTGQSIKPCNNTDRTVLLKYSRNRGVSKIPPMFGRTGTTDKLEGR